VQNFLGKIEERGKLAVGEIAGQADDDRFAIDRERAVLHRLAAGFQILRKPIEIAGEHEAGIGMSAVGAEIDGVGEPARSRVCAAGEKVDEVVEKVARTPVYRVVESGFADGNGGLACDDRPVIENVDLYG